MSGLRVLLVDDEEDFVEALAKRMRGRGFVAETAENGKVALSKAERETFDAVVLDLAMPGMDGIDTLKGLLELNPELQVILLTGHATVQKGVEAMKLGAADFLEKPAEFKELLAKIEKAGKKRALLVERRTAGEVSEILRKQGW